MGRSVFDEGALDDLLRRVDALTVDTLPGWGELDATRMLAHLREGCVMAKGDPDKSIRPQTLRQRLLAAIFIGPVPIPKGVEVPAKYLPPSAREEFESQRRGVHADLTAMCDAGTEVLRGIHPIFGPLSGAQWGRLVFKHAVHHLNQFGV